MGEEVQSNLYKGLYSRLAAMEDQLQELKDRAEAKDNYDHELLTEFQSMQRSINQTSDKCGRLEEELGDKVRDIHQEVKELRRGVSSFNQTSFGSACLSEVPMYYGYPEDYASWETSMEIFFKTLNVTLNHEQVALAIHGFKGSVKDWWRKVSNTYSVYWHENIHCWDELKTAMRRRFLPKSFLVDIQSKLLACCQRDLSVHNYFEEFEKLYSLSELDESSDVVAMKFMNGLREEIREKVYAFGSYDLYEAYHHALRVESNENVARRDQPGEEYQEWYDNHGLAIKPLKSWVRESRSQRCNVFTTHAFIGWDSKVPVMIDGGSSANLVSEALVQKQGLEIHPHVEPFTLQWLDGMVEVRVDKMVFVHFIIGEYVETCCFGVAPMEVCDLLLGRPWQFDKKAVHDGYSNTYTFYHQGKKIVLQSMNPCEVAKEKIGSKRQRVSTLEREKAERVSQKEKKGHDETRLECAHEKLPEVQTNGEEKGEENLSNPISCSFVHFAGTSLPDSRTNPSKEGEDDENLVASHPSNSCDEERRVLLSYNKSFLDIKQEKLSPSYGGYQDICNEVSTKFGVDLDSFDFGFQTEGLVSEDELMEIGPHEFVPKEHRPNH